MYAIKTEFIQVSHLLTVYLWCWYRFRVSKTEASLYHWSCIWLCQWKSGMRERENVKIPVSCNSVCWSRVLGNHRKTRAGTEKARLYCLTVSTPTNDFTLSDCSNHTPKSPHLSFTNLCCVHKNKSHIKCKACAFSKSRMLF